MRLLLRASALSLVLGAGCGAPQTSALPAPSPAVVVEAVQLSPHLALEAVAVYDGEVYGGGERGLFVLEGGAFKPLEAFDETEDRHCGEAPHEGHQPRTPAPPFVRHLKHLDGALWAATERFLWRYAGGVWERAGKGTYVGLTLHQGELVGASSRHLFSRRGAKVRRLNLRASEAEIHGVVSTGDDLVVWHADGLSRLRERRFEALVGPTLAGASRYRDLIALERRLVLATDEGVYVRWGAGEWRGLVLNAEPTSLAAGPAGEFWVGTTKGLVRAALEGVAGQLAVEGATPASRVNAIAVDAAAAYAATDVGVLRVPRRVESGFR